MGLDFSPEMGLDLFTRKWVPSLLSAVAGGYVDHHNHGGVHGGGHGGSHGGAHSGGQAMTMVLEMAMDQGPESGAATSLLSMVGA